MASPNSKVSVIIPAYGPTPHLAQVLISILGGSLEPTEVIVSHSGTADPTVALQAQFPQVQFLHSEERLYAGAARNRGVGISAGHLLAFCDCDVVPNKEWLKHLVSAIATEERRFVVGSIGMANKGGYWGQCTWYSEYSELADWHPAGRKIAGGSGNMMVRREDFLEVGGFPDHLPRAQDTALFSELRKTGLQQWFEPRARVDHHNLTGFKAFNQHMKMMGYHAAKIREIIPLPGHQATRFWPLALVLWIPKTLLQLKRITRPRGPGFVTALMIMPGLVLGNWIWTVGFLQKLTNKAKPSHEPRSNMLGR